MHSPAISDPSAAPPREPAQARLRGWGCPTCGRRELFGPAELDRCEREGWPVCCGEGVVGFVAEPEPDPHPPDLRVEE